MVPKETVKLKKLIYTVFILTLLMPDSMGAKKRVRGSPLHFKNRPSLHVVLGSSVQLHFPHDVTANSETY